MHNTGQPDTGTALQVSVIICAYTEKRWDEMIAAIESVRDQTSRPSELILIIDHNRPLYERVRNHYAGEIDRPMPGADTNENHPALIVIENYQAMGLSGARNSGIAIARGEVLAFMDEDAVAEHDWLEWLLQGYADPRVLGVGGSILPWWLEGQPDWFPEEFTWVVGCTYRGMPETTAPLRNLIGANMSLRREVFEKVGGFTNGIGRVGTLPVGCEETELCIRASQQIPGGLFLHQPNARVRHRIPPERTRWQYFYQRCYSEGLSKALVARSVGARQGLASERTYTFHTLPQGVFSSVKLAFSQRKLGALRRGVAIVSGLLVTTWGYLRGNLTGRIKLPFNRPAARPTADRGGT